MLRIAADSKHLGAKIGITSVRHTWGSAMTHHPHVHMIVPGGGFSADGSRWIGAKPHFFLPVFVLPRLFRRLMMEKLAAAHAAGKLVFFGTHAHLACANAFAKFQAPLRRKRWFVYAMEPFAGPKQVQIGLEHGRRTIVSKVVVSLLDQKLTHLMIDMGPHREQLFEQSLTCMRRHHVGEGAVEIVQALQRRSRMRFGQTIHDDAAKKHLVASVRYRLKQVPESSRGEIFCRACVVFKYQDAGQSRSYDPTPNCNVREKAANGWSR
jgi:hypothetical protein